MKYYHFAFFVSSDALGHSGTVGFNLDQEDILSAYYHIFLKKMALQAKHPNLLFEIEVCGYDFRSSKEMNEDKEEIKRLLGVEEISFY